MEHRNSISEVRERVRPEVEAALDRARRELQGLDIRRRELLGEIESAEGFLGLEEDGGDDPMTLHEAMVAVLKEWQQSRVTKLADEIEKRGLYRRKNGKPVDAHQLHSRINRYQDLFVRVSPGVVALRDGV